MPLDSAFVTKMRSWGISPSSFIWPALLALAGVVEALTQHFTPYVASLGPLLLACVLLGARRSHPYFTLAGILASYALAPLLGDHASESAVWIIVFVFACFAVGRNLPRSEVLRGLLAVIGFFASLLAILVFLSSFSPDIIFGVAATLAPWMLGVTVRAAEDRAATLTREFERARAAEQLVAERSARAERDQIAREIHDVLAHSLSLMIVQSEVAESILDRDPNAARNANKEVQKAGRSALDEVGRLVRLIRREAMLDDIDPLEQVHGDLVGSIRKLTEDVARAGQPVTVDGVLDRDLPPALEVTVFRVVQEGLTNALKHAPGAATRVLLREDDEAVEVRVSNGPGRSSVATGTTGGYGLAGLQERVDLFAGTLSFGPDAAGGFDVHARLPIGAPV